jgi:hypothetical protein
MGEQIAVLEAAAAAAVTVDAEDAAWDDFLDDDAKRMRTFLRKMLCLTKEAKQLSHERTLLDRLLREHGFWVAAMRKRVQDDAVNRNDWAANVTRWHALSLAYFRPWTLDDCRVEVAAALFEMKQFAMRSDTTSSGLSLFGWHDQRRLDRAKASIEFCFHKTFRGCDLLRHAQHHWDTYTKQDVYRRIVLGGNALVNLEVLQQLTPDMWIVRYDERYAGDHLNVHILYLVFRMKQKNGFLMFLRSIACPGVQRATHSETDCWGSDFIWFRWELLDGNNGDGPVDFACADYQQTIGGSIAGDDLSYANRWLFEALAAVIRAENAAINKHCLQF